MDKKELLELKARIRPAGLNQRILASRLAMDETVLSRYLNGHIPMTVDLDRRIRAQLGLQVTQGLAEDPAAFVAQARAVPADALWLRQVAPGVDRPLAFDLSCPIPALGLNEGDTLVADTSRTAPEDGLFLVNVVRPDGQPVTQLRRQARGMFVATDPRDPEPILDDSDRIGCIGRLVVAVRKFNP